MAFVPQDFARTHVNCGQLARSAGGSAQVMAKEERYVLVRLPSGEIRKILADCLATIGQVGNVEHSQIKLGRAGRARNSGSNTEPIRV